MRKTKVKKATSLELIPIPQRRPVGRPTDYDPAMCQRVLELGGAGYSKAMIAYELDCTHQSLENWAQLHPEFFEAMHRARELSMGWWEKQGQLGIWSRDFNANAYRLQIMNRFPESWRDKVEVDHRAPDGPLVQIYMPGNGRDI